MAILTRRPRSGWAWLITGALLVGTTGCEFRDRDNPLDPMNDETSGEPDWLVAFADDGAVDLEWVEVPSDGFAGYELFRAVPDSAMTRIASLRRANATAFRDEPVPNGADVRYRLDILLTNGGRVSLPDKVATPGSAVPWILENSPFGLLRASPDGRHLRLRTGSVNGHFDAVASVDGSEVWVSDYFGGRVTRHTKSGSEVGRIDVSLPFRIAVDWGAEVVWTGTWQIGRAPTLRAFDFEGTELAEFPLVGELRDLVVDPTSGACFVARGRTGGLARAAVGDSLFTAGTGEFMMLAIRDGDRLYAGDPFADRVVAHELDSLASLDTFDTTDSPQTLTVAGDDVWVVDGADRIHRLSSQLVLAETVEGVGSATSVAADPESGALWLAIPERDRVIRLDPGSGPTATLTLFQPFLVTLGGRAQ